MNVYSLVYQQALLIIMIIIFDEHGVSTSGTSDRCIDESYTPITSYLDP